MAVSQKNNHNEEQIFDLDNSAIIYAATHKKNWNRTFRVAVVLNQDIQPELVKQAIADLKKRFPSLYVQLTTGFFAYKLRTVQDTDVLVQESAYPCRPIVVGKGEKPMFRVLYFKNRLTVEIFHVVTDGSGAITLLKNILARYLELQGCQIEKTDGIFDLAETPKASETEDSFLKLKCDDDSKISRSEAAAYKYFPEINENYFRLTHGLFSVDELKKITKPKGVTITEYLVAVYAWAFYKNMLPDLSEKPIKISVPTDLRRLFDSSTIRNFSLFVNIYIYPKKEEQTFDDILSETVKQMKAGLTKEKLLRSACKNVSDSNMPVFRFMPLFIKKRVLRIGFVLLGERLISTSFSNIGIVSVPNGMTSHIDHFDFVLGGTPKNYINMGGVSFNNIINITFSSKSEKTDIQRIFFKFLTEQGVKINIQSNVQQKNDSSSIVLHCKKCNVEFKDNQINCPLCGEKADKSDEPLTIITAPYPEL